MIMVRYAEVCPFTGLALKKQYKLTPQVGGQFGDAPQVSYLYEFKPIGRALIDAGIFITYSIMVEEGNRAPNKVLAGLCREAAELKQEPPVITAQMFDRVDVAVPKTFGEKRMHLLRLICKAGGEEYIKRYINTHEDFPLGFADSPAELHRMLESLVDDNLLRYEKSYRVQGDYKDGLLAHYHEVLPTSTGKQLVLSSDKPQYPTTMPSNSFSFGPNSTVHLVQGDNATQTNVLGNSANVNVAHGNNNSQINSAQAVDSLKALMEQLTPVLRDAAFDAHRDEIDAEMERIKVQLNKPEPKKSFLKKAFDSLLGSLEEVATEGAGSVIAQTAIELVKQGPLLLTALGA